MKAIRSYRDYIIYIIRLRWHDFIIFSVDFILFMAAIIAFGLLIGRHSGDEINRALALGPLTYAIFKLAWGAFKAIRTASYYYRPPLGKIINHDRIPLGADKIIRLTDLKPSEQEENWGFVSHRLMSGG